MRSARRGAARHGSTLLREGGQHSPRHAWRATAGAGLRAAALTPRQCRATQRAGSTRGGGGGQRQRQRVPRQRVRHSCNRPTDKARPVARRTARCTACCAGVRLTRAPLRTGLRRAQHEEGRSAAVVFPVLLATRVKIDTYAQLLSFYSRRERETGACGPINA
jgi:hypothetical protein